jgi:septal ring factor EnvC (AmiA/AmiB activator)
MVRVLSFSQTISKAVILGVAAFLLLWHSAEILVAQSYGIGIVTSNQLNLRSGPGFEKRIIYVLPKGTKVQVLSEHNGWLEVSYQGQTGYLRARPRYIHVVPIKPSGKNQIKTDTHKDIKRFKEESENISQKIKKGEAEILTFTKKEVSIVNNLNQIDLALNDAKGRAWKLEDDLVALEKQISETIRASKNLVKAIEENEGYVSQRVVSMYKLNWLGQLNILASAESLYDLFHRKKTLELILANDQNTMEKLLKDKYEHQLLLARLNSQKMKKISLEADVEKHIRLMSDKKEERESLLKEIRSKRTLEMAAIESLKQSAKELNRVINSLSKTTVPSEQTKKIPPKSFTSLKGLLNMPVQGKIVSFFGPYRNTKFNVVNFRSGIVIKADRGEPIRAVSDGKVLYANWFKGYGNMIIIDHGDNYYTVYAHAEELFTLKGDIVEQGEVVATVGDSGSLVGPTLHFEVRHRGKPMDPLKWIKKG